MFQVIHEGFQTNLTDSIMSMTWIPYQLKEDSDVVIKIYTATGPLVRTLKSAGFLQLLSDSG